MSGMIETDTYGRVTEGTWKFLKKNGITQGEWWALTSVLGGTHDDACAIIREFTNPDGGYDSWRGEQAASERWKNGS